MAQTHFLALPNKDLISSFSFNYYGTRLAVSSLDHHIYILSSDPETGKWPEDHSQEQPASQPNPEPSPGATPILNQKNTSIQAWTAHEGPVIKVIWSDPIHGEILASAGTDGTVRIWEEDTRRIDYPSGNETTGNKSNPAAKQNAALSPGGWYQQTILADSNRTIRDIGFSPSETSLRLASISSDHHLRIYECLETNSFSSDNWNLVIDIDMSVLPSYPTTTSDHLNPNLAPNNAGPSSSAVTGGTTTTTTTTTTGFQQHSHSPFTSVRGFDPSTSLNTVKNNNNPSTAGTNFNLINPLSGLRSSTITPTHPSSSSAFNPPATSSERSNLESFGGWSLSWCPESYWGNILAASAGSSGLIRLFKFTSHAQWENFGILNPLNFSNPNSAIHDPTLPPSSHLNHTNHSIRRHASTGNASSTIGAATTNANTTTTNSTAAAAGTTTAAASSSSSSFAAHISPVSSLAWAPPCGRDYHLIAAGHRDGRARIWKLVVPNDAASEWKLELNTELEDHVSSSSSSTAAPHLTNNHPIPPPSKSHDGPTPATGGGVGKCEWNISGTVLSTSGSDGKIRIWKMGYTSRWVNTAEINCVEHSNPNHPHSDTGHHTPALLQPTPNTGEAITVG